MRAAVLTAASVVLTTLVLGNAWSQRQQFYPSVVYITKSNPSMAVIYLQVLRILILIDLLILHVLVSCSGDLDGETDEKNLLWSTASSRVRASDGEELVRCHRDLSRIHSVQVRKKHHCVQIF